MKKVIDKNGIKICIGMSVLMPEPNETDIYIIGDWYGNVEDIFDNGNILVTDSEGDFYEIEGDRVEYDQD
jgi:hypothetical protein